MITTTSTTLTTKKTTKTTKIQQRQQFPPTFSFLQTSIFFYFLYD